MEWIWLIVPVIMLLKTVEKGGDWFDFLQSEARYDNWWTNFEFASIFPIIGVCVAGVAFIVIFGAMRSPEPSPAFMPVNQTKIASAQGYSAAKAHDANHNSQSKHSQIKK